MQPIFAVKDLAAHVFGYVVDWQLPKPQLTEPARPASNPPSGARASTATAKRTNPGAERDCSIEQAWR